MEILNCPGGQDNGVLFLSCGGTVKMAQQAPRTAPLPFPEDVLLCKVPVADVVNGLARAVQICQGTRITMVNGWHLPLEIPREFHLCQKDLEAMLKPAPNPPPNK